MFSMFSMFSSFTVSIMNLKFARSSTLNKLNYNINFNHVILQMLQSNIHTFCFLKKPDSFMCYCNSEIHVLSGANWLLLRCVRYPELATH